MTNKRIGPKMIEAYEYIKTHPYCTKLEVAKAIGPNGSVRYGYEIVNRTISAGIINALWLDKFGRYALTAEYIQEHA